MSRGLKMINMALGQNLTFENLIQLGKNQSILTCNVQEDGSLAIANTTEPNNNSQILEIHDTLHNCENETLEQVTSLPIFVDTENSIPKPGNYIEIESSYIQIDQNAENTSIYKDISNIDQESTCTPMDHIDERVSQPDEQLFNIMLNLSTDTPENVARLWTPEKPKSKRFNVNKNVWKTRRNAKRREKGLPYKSKQNTNSVWKYDLIKPAKSLKPRCNCSLSEKSTSIIKCFEITEDDRLAIFKEFWALTWGEKTVFVKGLIQIAEKQRLRLRSNNENGISRRTNSYKYFLRKANGTQHRVCKNMFVGTIGMSHSTILNWINDKNKEGCGPVISNNDKVELTTFQARSKLVKDSLRHFFECLAKMESHYCRASTSKMYLEPEWTSKSRLYQEYKNNWCSKNNIAPASITSFCNLFERLNLSLFQPKKDQCDICVGHKTKNVTDAIYEEHQIKKKSARTEKLKDKESNIENVFTMDLQSVLLCPKSNVSSLYYKTKLMVHNFTIYNLKTNDGFCFIWHEGEGGVGSNEFSTILSHFILTEVLPNVKNRDDEIIFYSDGCANQNRNSTLSNALLNIAMTSHVTIVQKILEKGHTQMEVDSMHSVIEKQIKTRTINVPADYVDICRQARLKPRPYTVKYLDHTFFKNFSTIEYYKSIRPGKAVGDATVTQIRCIKYNTDGRIQLKLNFHDEWFDLPQRLNRQIKPIDFENLSGLYTSRLSIKKTKFDHLQSLKSTMPLDYHSFYDELPYE